MDEVQLMSVIIAELEHELQFKGFEVSRPEIINKEYMMFLLSCLGVLDK